MKVRLLSYTPEALELLLLTKETRLGFTVEEVKSWSLSRKMAELDYMLGTIQSSWEFVDFVFSVEGVSRAFTHQFVRTRQGSYAQQSQRTVDMTGFDFVWPNESFRDAAENIVHEIDRTYDQLLANGYPPQDARSILPTNIATNIIAKFNLRTLSEMAKVRLCTRTQGEYQTVFRAMREEVIKVYPWTEPFIEVHCVALGVCAFPNYAECPIKDPVFNPATGGRWDGLPERPATRREIKKVWELTRFEARPTGVSRKAP